MRVHFAVIGISGWWGVYKFRQQQQQQQQQQTEAATSCSLFDFGVQHVFI